MNFLPQRFAEIAKKSPDSIAFDYFDQTEAVWKTMTWSEYYRSVVSVACYLRDQLEIRKGDRVLILSANRPEWIIADLAIVSIGAVSVPVYATSSPNDVSYILQHSQARWMFVDTVERYEQSGAAAIGQPAIFFESAVSKLPENSESMREAMTYGAEANFEAERVSANDLVSIIYTSGTTGNPKGVMHTHGTFAQAMQSVGELFGRLNVNGDDHFFSFLPLSHVAERVLVELGTMITGARVSFARSVAHLAEDLVKHRPTVLLCVPRLWEKMHEKILIQLKKASLIKRFVFWLARTFGVLARVRGRRILHRGGNSFFAAISDGLVGSALRAKLGLDRTRLFITGSAPTRFEVLKFFAAFDIRIHEVYGLTENLCLGNHNVDTDVTAGVCGHPFSGNRFKIAEDGEILFKSPSVFVGYYRDEETTKAVLTEDGWFRTGDLGAIRPDGQLQIVGRKKELIKTSTGKYVAPVPIEDKLKCLEIIQDAIVVGDNQKFCVALISLQEVEVSRDVIADELLRFINSMNESLAHHEAVKKVGILKSPLTITDGHLTPTLKLRRKNIETSYSQFIHKVYSTSDVVVWH